MDERGRNHRAIARWLPAKAFVWSVAVSSRVCRGTRAQGRISEYMSGKRTPGVEEDDLVTRDTFELEEVFEGRGTVRCRMAHPLQGCHRAENSKRSLRGKFDRGVWGSVAADGPIPEEPTSASDDGSAQSLLESLEAVRGVDDPVGSWISCRLP